MGPPREKRQPLPHTALPMKYAAWGEERVPTPPFPGPRTAHPKHHPDVPCWGPNTPLQSNLLVEGPPARAFEKRRPPYSSAVATRRWRPTARKFDPTPCTLQVT